MKSTKKAVQKVADKSIAAGVREAKDAPKRIVKAKVVFDEAGANAALEMSKITITEKDQNTYDISVFFVDDREPKNTGEINAAHVQQFFSNLYEIVAKQVNPTLRLKPPRPPKVMEMNF